MLLLQANKIEKYYADRLIFRFDTLSVFKGDKIGIVGPNGAGKTTLLHLLAGLEQADSGDIQRYGRASFIAQEETAGGKANRSGLFTAGGSEHFVEKQQEKRRLEQLSKEIGLRQHELHEQHLSGGEETKLRIVQALAAKGDILFADEPTSHVDVAGVQYIEAQLMNFKGAVLLVSHDRRLLEQVCTKILEVENGKLTEYAGSYSTYKEQKEIEKQTQQLEYDKYVQEKKRLSAAIIDRDSHAQSFRKAPKRMGNSEARLHKREAGERRAEIEKAKKSIATRLEKLEVKEKPAAPPQIEMELHESLKLHAKYAITATDVSKKVGQRTLFQNASMQIRTGSKVALMGPNGCGKSTLIQMILQQEAGIKTAQGCKFGYFDQKLDDLDPQQTILQYIQQACVYSPDLVRTVLARMGFKREAVHKQIGLLSGGEKVKVALSKLLLGQHNVLVLDEPTNYLDLFALEALEELLQAYQGTLLFVTHDREFIDRVANQLLIFEEGRVQQVSGNYSQFLANQKAQKKAPKKDIQEQILVLENQLQHLIGRLSLPSPTDHLPDLEQEYQEVLAALKRARAER